MSTKDAILETERHLSAAVYATRKAKTNPRNRSAHVKAAAAAIADAGKAIAKATPAAPKPAAPKKAAAKKAKKCAVRNREPAKPWIEWSANWLTVGPIGITPRKKPAKPRSRMNAKQRANAKQRGLNDAEFQLVRAVFRSGHD